MSTDYGNTIIYKISCKDTSITDLYVGHTTDFVKRKYAHKRACTNMNMSSKLYKFIRENGGWENWNIQIVNFFNCKDLYEAREKEQEYFIRLNATLNSIEPLPESCNLALIRVSDTSVYNKSACENVISIQGGDYKECDKNRTCNFCDVKCSRKNDWDRHILTTKHQKNMKFDDSVSSNKIEFCCEKCDYSCSKLFLWEKHIDTTKHKLPNIPHKYECLKCEKVYDRYNSFWAHSKKCTQITKNTHDVSPIERENTSQYMDLINRLIIDNQELRNFIIEQSKTSSENMNKIIEQNTDVVSKAIECFKNTSSNTTINCKCE